MDSSPNRPTGEAIAGPPGYSGGGGGGGGVHTELYTRGGAIPNEMGPTQEEEFIQNRTRAGARFQKRWDHHAVAQRRP